MNRLVLHDLHAAQGATFGEFADHSMPLHYRKPVEEHHAVRRGAGVFDISHMGQFELSGERAEELLAYLLTADVRAMTDGGALYSPLCREDAGVLDDLIAYRHDPRRYRLIVNGATRQWDWEWLDSIAQDFHCALEDLTPGLCLLAVQGPQALESLAAPAERAPATLRYFSFVETRLWGLPVFMARTGYTGEPGCELAVSVDQALALWEHLTGELGLPPIGLAARDTLRLEAALPLYGHDLREEWHPLESGLGWAVRLDSPEEFIGKKALLAMRGAGIPYRQVGLEMTGRGIPREGHAVLHEGQPVGAVTSGTLSPTTGKAIALARIRHIAAAAGTPVQVVIRDRPVDAVVVRRPFYRNPKLRE